MTKYKLLEGLVLDWAMKKGLTGDNANPDKQCLKAASEMGELCDAVCKGDEDETIDALGDVMVTIIILADQLNLDLLVCLETAYGVKAERKGQTINGTFIKD